MAKKTTESSVTYGSDNVFADIGLPNAEDLLAKAKLASAISDIIEERSLTQKQAAELMGLDQPKVSKILSGRLNDFSTERLLSCLLHMGLDVDIVIHKKANPGQREGVLNVASV